MSTRPLSIRLTPLLAALAAVVLLVGTPRAAPARDPGPAAPPASFAGVAAAARAAAITLRAPVDDRYPLPDLGPARTDCEPADSACAEEEDFRRFVAQALAALRQRTLGAGVIVDPAGLAVANATAALLEPGFEVGLSDGSTVTATVIGLDRRTDLALLRLDDRARIYPHLPLGDSTRLEVGEWVLAVGAPHGLEGTVTAGVVSGRPRPGQPGPLAAFIQFDAAVARGNAGGPLVNLRGEVVGIATRLVHDGTGLALPSQAVRRVYLELLERGRVIRPWLGLSAQALTAEVARALRAPDTSGVLVSDVEARGPADQAGLRPGDIILALDGTPVASPAHLGQGLASATPGRTVRVRVRRAGRESTVAVRLGEEPDDWQLPPPLARARRVLGLDVRPITSDMGVVVAQVRPGGPAARAGLERGDVIRAVGARRIRTLADFEAAARDLPRGAPLLLHVQRTDTALYTVVTTAGD
jgi:serine protease Do